MLKALACASVFFATTYFIKQNQHRIGRDPESKTQHKDGFENVKNAFVVVVGLGGVGSAAAHVLLRSGVKKMRLIDPDLVTLSSLNRNALAQRCDVGRSKVSTMKDYFSRIVPETDIEIVEAFFEIEVADNLLQGKPDYVLDCIDDTKTKLQLLKYCYENEIKVISSFGAGGGIDPTTIKVSDIKQTHTCPLGRVLRKSLAEENITTGIICVYSTEKNKKKLILHQEDLERLREQNIQRKVRVGTLPVTMVMPTTFGAVLANTVLHDLAGVQIPFTVDEDSPYLGQAKRMHKSFVAKEVSMGTSKWEAEYSISVSEVFEVLEVFKLESALSGAPAKSIVRWRKDRPISPMNIIPVTNQELKAHIKMEDLSSYDPDVVSRIDNLLVKATTTILENENYTI
eukprot:TRINITY_DN1220_c0_g1_i6.p1 TRINITY_DN1220_c0_g1~~TRINITY_DN1220_c0_g1_i6.p1  ORF type:complete len:399 (-),score=100.53 TRINITY_DN1220_c0_g1_i6:31-1227(-)